MLVIKTYPEIYDQVRIPETNEAAQVVLISHDKETVTVQTADSRRLECPWSVDLELVRFNPTRLIPGSPDLLIEIIARRESSMTLFEYEEARQKAESLFNPTTATAHPAAHHQ
jgi:hypothetical protein